MAKKDNITTKTGRASLKPRREPYWARIGIGLYIGYRQLQQGNGTWIARMRNEEEKQVYQALGTFDDFYAAVKSAEQWATSVEIGVVEHATTVSEACRRYLKHLQISKGDSSAKDAEGRFKRRVYEAPIGRIKLSRLKTSDLKEWLYAQVKDSDNAEMVRKSKDSANRNLASLKAALNLALDDKLVANDGAWRTVVPFSKVGKRREGYLSLEQRQALIEKCPNDVRVLGKSLLLTGIRPGEIAKANVGDFAQAFGTLAVNGKTGIRIVTLSTTAIQHLEEQVNDRSDDAPLLTQENRARWNKDAWKKPFKEAALDVGLPAGTVLYSLRHTAISDLIAGGMDSFLVAKIAGTSVAMIEKHYGHIRHQKLRAQLDAIAMI